VLGVLAVVSGTWGMNLEHGLETMPGVFHGVCAGMLLGGSGAFLGLSRHYRRKLSLDQIQL